MVRGAMALALSMVVPAALFVAPFTHAHQDDHATAHHRGGAMHAHVAEHAAAAPHDATLIEADDHDRAVFISGIAGIAWSAVSFTAETIDFVTLAAPAMPTRRANTTRTPGHDPPRLDSLAPRAPPAFLS